MAAPVNLTVDECLALLSEEAVGRVALSTPAGVRIVPVNYTLYGEAIVFRTEPASELGAYGWDGDVAFEVDRLDYEQYQGWSVVARGQVRLVEDPDELRRIKQRWDPQPWAGGRRTQYLKMTWEDLTGRRIGEDRAGTPETSARRAL
jgi:nitroimidazol reductase NimA-like FMN-containing flavoprotein (pyridoxamine 5'-phosphate oxidase superfamily)